PRAETCPGASATRLGVWGVDAPGHDGSDPRLILQSFLVASLSPRWRPVVPVGSLRQLVSPLTRALVLGVIDRRSGRRDTRASPFLFDCRSRIPAGSN